MKKLHSINHTGAGGKGLLSQSLGGFCSEVLYIFQGELRALGQNLSKVWEGGMAAWNLLGSDTKPTPAWAPSNSTKDKSVPRDNVL